MDLKCLINVINEKEYSVSIDNGITIDFCTEYESVFKKIMSVAKQDNHYYAYPNSKKSITIVDLHKLHDYLIESYQEVSNLVLNDKKKLFLIPGVQKAILNCFDDFDIDIIRGFVQDDIKIINLKEKEKREQERQRKIQEVEDFISSLP